jgi:phage gp36-like protein
MKGEPDVTDEYQKRYDQALAMLKQLAEGKNRQDMFRTLQVRYPVR